MSLVYRILYTLGITPWDNEQIPPELSESVGKLPRGRALDFGCGTGTDAVWLAKQGFDVVGIDVVNKPIARALLRAKKDGVNVRFLVADAAASEMDLGEPFSLLLDVGCFQSVPDSVRDGLVRAYARYAAPGATLLLFAFPPRNGPGPKGAGREELERRLGADWDLIETRVDEHTPVPRLLTRGGRPIWFVWRRK
jgi:SAM-dependent methyltransferase